MIKYRTPTQSNYPNRVLKSRIAEVVSTAVSPEAAAPLAGMEKENAAATAEIRIADTGWLPEARAKRDTQIHRRYRRLESSSYVSRSSCESRGGGVLACPVARGARSRCTTRPGGETLDAIKDHNEIRDALAHVAEYQAGTMHVIKLLLTSTRRTVIIWPKKSARE